MMKLTLILLVLLIALTYTDAYFKRRGKGYPGKGYPGRKWPPRPRGCYDCYGRPQREGVRYFDGCNWCVCGWDGTPACSYMACPYNRCTYKKYGRYPRYGGY